MLRARAFRRRAKIEHYGPDPAGDVDGTRVLLETVEGVPCNLQPQWSREDTVNLDQSSRSWNLYFPPGVTLGHQDRVVVDGLELEAIGEGQAVADLGGRPHHVEAVVRRTQ